MPLIRFAGAKIISLLTDSCFPELSSVRTQRSNTDTTPPCQPLLNSALHRLQPQRLWAPKQLMHPGPSNFRAYHWHQPRTVPARKYSHFSLVLLFALSLVFLEIRDKRTIRKHPTISVPLQPFTKLQCKRVISSLSQYQDSVKSSCYYLAQSLSVF